jgi:transcriptional regulator
VYLPAHFEETRTDVLHALMRGHPLATLVTCEGGALDANHLPLHLDAAIGSLGCLRGHMARANPLWRAFEQPGEVLAIFHGPQAYVTPAWYPAKQQTGRVVPTWNYAVVHAHGTLRVIDGDARWLRGQLDDLTAQQEAARPHPWKVGDAPADYLASMMSAIVGFEIVISRLTGKFKLSQNHPEVNRQAVREGLADGDARSRDLAAFMQAHGKPRS